MKMSLKLTFVFLLSLAVVAIISGCSAFAVTVSSIEVYPSRISLPKNNQEMLKVIILPANASNTEITWRSENPEVATVNSSGIVTAVSQGSAYVVATSISSNRESICIVTVTDKEIPPTSISVNPDSMTMEAQEVRTLTLNFNPANATSKTEWVTSNSSVATVDSYGRVTAKNKGTATITVRSTVNTSKTAQCKVTVLAPQSITGIDLSRTSANLYVGSYIEIDAAVLGQNIRDYTVNTSVTGSSYVSVSKTNTSNGARIRISGKSAGTATIRVYSNANSNYYSTITITVVN